MNLTFSCSVLIKKCFITRRNWWNWRFVFPTFSFFVELLLNPMGFESYYWHKCIRNLLEMFACTPNSLLSMTEKSFKLCFSQITKKVFNIENEIFDKYFNFYKFQAEGPKILAAFIQCILTCRGAVNAWSCNLKIASNVRQILSDRAISKCGLFFFAQYLKKWRKSHILL